MLDSFYHNIIYNIIVIIIICIILSISEHFLKDELAIYFQVFGRPSNPNVASFTTLLHRRIASLRLCARERKKKMLLLFLHKESSSWSPYYYRFSRVYRYSVGNTSPSWIANEKGDDEEDSSFVSFPSDFCIGILLYRKCA